VTLREEHRLRVFENRVLRTILESKRDKVTGGWRKLHNEEFHILYSSRNIVTLAKTWRIRWKGYVTSMGAERYKHKVLIWKPKG
jgi:hypothetical protein